MYYSIKKGIMFSNLYFALGILLTTLTVREFSAQSIHSNDIIRHFKLDNSDMSDEKTIQYGIQFGNISPTSDRWGNPTGAIKMSSKFSYIDLKG